MQNYVVKVVTFFISYVIFNMTQTPITKLHFSTPNLGFYKTTPIHSHNQTLKINLALGLAYWTWFLFIFVLNSMPITKLFFSTPNLGFCKMGHHHSHNQTLKVITCSRPCILTFTFHFCVQLIDHHQTPSYSKTSLFVCIYMLTNTHMGEHKNNLFYQILRKWITQLLMP